MVTKRSDLFFPGQVFGSVLYYDGAKWTFLEPGTSGQVLKTNGLGYAPEWVDVSDVSVSDSIYATVSGTRFSGNITIVGTGTFESGISGSLTRLANGTSFIVGSTGINVVSASNGQITLSANDSVVATVSGSRFSGNITVVGTGTFESGISGSHTRLANGTSFLVAGSNVTITSASNGQVTIASSGTGSSATVDATVYASASLPYVGGSTTLPPKLRTAYMLHETIGNRYDLLKRVHLTEASGSTFFTTGPSTNIPFAWNSPTNSSGYLTTTIDASAITGICKSGGSADFDITLWLSSYSYSGYEQYALYFSKASLRWVAAGGARLMWAAVDTWGGLAQAEFAHTDSDWKFVRLKYRAGVGIEISVNDGTPGTAALTGTLATSESSILVGGWPTTNTNAWYGKLAQVCIWDAITDAEETFLYNTGSGQIIR